MSKIIKLSRSTVERYISCPRCCYLEKNHQIKPPSLPFSLNIAVDNLCKNEFDFYRKNKKPHPLFKLHNIDAIPFDHKDIDIWRNNYKGLRYKSLKYNYDFGGAIDEVWQKNNGELIIADFKATSKNIFDWEDIFAKYDYPKAYQRQLEMYQWLFKQNGFSVSKEAYIIYYNGQKNRKFFENSLQFDVHVIKLNCSTDWVEKKIIETVEFLRSNNFPKPNSSCQFCNYIKQRWLLAQNL